LHQRLHPIPHLHHVALVGGVAGVLSSLLSMASNESTPTRAI
jgi:hypothetical protein